MSQSAHANKVAGIVLASGLSSRFGPSNKLLAPIRGVPLIVWTVRAYIETRLDDVIVVAGHGFDDVASALSDLPVRCVFNPRYQLGQSTSLVCGVRSVRPGAEAAVIGVADQPLLTAAHIGQLVDRFHCRREPIVAARYAGERGNPVLFAASLFPELEQVTGDQGGRPVLLAHQSRIGWVDFPEEDTASDVDTPDDLRRVEAALENRARRSSD